MAKVTEIPTDLTLDIGGEISPDDFVAAVRNFFGYVKEITESQEGDGVKVDWSVVVKEGSSLVGLEPSLAVPVSRLAMIYNKVDHGFAALARGDIKGAGLSERAVNHLKVLSELTSRTDASPTMRVWVRRKPVAVSASIAKTVKESWDADYYDYGTVEGRLEAIQDANGSLRIRVQDFLFSKPIRCTVPEDMIAQVFDSFRKRVEITGRIHYRRDGVAISIEASEIQILPEDNELPSAYDVRGIFAA